MVDYLNLGKRRFQVCGVECNYIQVSDIVLQIREQPPEEIPGFIYRD